MATAMPTGFFDGADRWRASCLLAEGVDVQPSVHSNLALVLPAARLSVIGRLSCTRQTVDGSSFSSAPSGGYVCGSLRRRLYCVHRSGAVRTGMTTVSREPYSDVCVKVDSISLIIARASWKKRARTARTFSAGIVGLICGRAGVRSCPTPRK